MMLSELLRCEERRGKDKEGRKQWKKATDLARSTKITTHYCMYTALGWHFVPEWLLFMV